jgi:hypothetical protein
MPLLAACAGQVPFNVSDTSLVATQIIPPNCREFTAQVAVEGQTQQAVGQTCLQPDGSWLVTLNTPGLPQQVYTLPPQAMYQVSYPGPYYGWNPWFYGPLFVDGPVFVANGVHHFHRHHFKQQGGGHHGGSHGGRR